MEADHVGKPMKMLACCAMAAAVATVGCGAKPRTVVVLVPSPGGSTGGITVSNTAGSVDIDTANHFTQVGDATAAPRAPAPMSDSEIHRIFGPALTALPPAPLHFVLHFGADSTELVPDSSAKLPEIVVAIRQRGADAVSVVGHSDTSGEKAYNLALSMRRAEAVKDRLVALGVAAAAIDVTSHGEGNPLVQTGDNVKEEKNRRVEVVVR